MIGKWIKSKQLNGEISITLPSTSIISTNNINKNSTNNKSSATVLPIW